MLKLPKGLKKKKKGKKSKRKGEDELFTEEELEKYRREQQQQQSEAGEPPAKENEEWSKFKDLTTGVDSVLRKTQGDLDRIKSTSFFQRVPAGAKELERAAPPRPARPVVELTEADFPQLVQAAAATATAAADDERSDLALTDDESEEEEQDDIFDTSYVEAVERGEVKLAYVPDSPDEPPDDDLFDTSHVDALIHGHDAKTSKGRKALDIGIAVGVLTGRIDNVTVTTSRRPKRVIPGDLLLDNTERDLPAAAVAPEASDSLEKSILDTDPDLPIDTPIDLSVSLHAALIQQNKKASYEDLTELDKPVAAAAQPVDDEEEVDEFTLLAAESLESNADVIKVENEIQLAPVLQESWSAFEADKNESVFAECIVEDQIDVVDPYLDQNDPFDTSFAEAVVPSPRIIQNTKEAVILEDDDDFDPRAEEIQYQLNNRRKSSVRIHLTDPSGLRESITSDDIVDKGSQASRDLLGGSTTDLTQLGDSPLDPVDVSDGRVDPFDTTIVDNIVAPGRVELKLLERELIGSSPVPAPVYRVPSDPDFDPRADEPKRAERRASRPENLVVSKSVVFDVEEDTVNLDIRTKPPKPVTPYYTRGVSIGEALTEEAESGEGAGRLPRARSDDDLAPRPALRAARRHSELPQPQRQPPADLLHAAPAPLAAKVLTPAAPAPAPHTHPADPFDTSFATDIAPSKTELKLLAKEFSCEDSPPGSRLEGEPDLLEPADDIFQVKALTPEPSAAPRLPHEDFDPFDTSFAGDLNPGRTELKLLESEFLN